jgi:low temperature requirement protein LtrA
MFSEFRRRFWLPPRAHGDIIADRTVSFLELFYDLVYVVVIARAANTLAEEITWRSVSEFVVVFGLIWIAWLNGTLYYELHGHEDGRTRFFVFVQMLLLALLAVFTADAAGESGRPFAIVYTLYLIVVTWLWYTVRRHDSQEYMAITARYITGMIVSIVVIGVSAWLPAEWRTIFWGVTVALALVAMSLLSRSSNIQFGITVTDSMVERFGLFVIIVLGEVVVGVVDGLSDAVRTAGTIATGMVGLTIGFAIWWTYFDFIGRRRPIDTPTMRMRWMISYLPLTLAIAAAGAAMVSLIDHAEDAATPAPTAWLLSGSVALALLAMVLQMPTLLDYPRLPTLYRPVSLWMMGAAVVALLAGWFAPAPWLLALVLVLTLSAVWVFAVVRWLQLDDPDSIRPNLE